MTRIYFRMSIRTNAPAHTYRFKLFQHKNNPIQTECIIIYRAENKISDVLLEVIARTVITQATLLWMQGDNMCLDDGMNMETFKGLFKNQNESEMLKVLEPFNSLIINNDWIITGCPELNNVRIYME